MSIKLIDFAEYEKIASEIGGRHWENYVARWDYHRVSVSMIEELEINDPEDVLEAGTMGVQLVKGSHTIDMPVQANNRDWVLKQDKATFYHDLRDVPWPIKDKKYKLFCALRVWHHLGDMQKECFLEAKRIADYVLLVIPQDTSNNVHARGLKPEQLCEWNGKLFDKFVDLGPTGTVYLFS